MISVLWPLRLLDSGHSHLMSQISSNCFMDAFQLSNLGCVACRTCIFHSYLTRNTGPDDHIGKQMARRFYQSCIKLGSWRKLLSFQICLNSQSGPLLPWIVMERSPGLSSADGPALDISPQGRAEKAEAARLTTSRHPTQNHSPTVVERRHTCARRNCGS